MHYRRIRDDFFLFELSSTIIQLYVILIYMYHDVTELCLRLYCLTTKLFLVF